MTSERIYDVAVVGAGPAGAVVAIVLSRLVRSVVLIEAAAFPRSHIGISVGPGVRRQLYHLGLGSVFETETFSEALRSIGAGRAIPS